MTDHDKTQAAVLCFGLSFLCCAVCAVIEVWSGAIVFGFITGAFFGRMKG